MKTELLIEMLARGAHQEVRTSPWRVLYLSIGCGVVLSIAMMGATLRINPEIQAILGDSKFWVKVAYVCATLVLAFYSLIVVARPGARLNVQMLRLAMPVIVMFFAALLDIWAATPVERVSLIQGQTWSVCAILIAFLSLPVFAATMWAMKDLAPTDLSLAGAVSGLFSGAAGALVYCIHCPELEVPFIAVWYTLGMLVPVLLGYSLGPRVLRW